MFCVFHTSPELAVAGNPPEIGHLGGWPNRKTKRKRKSKKSTWERRTTHEKQVKAEAYSYPTAVRRRARRKTWRDDDKRRNRSKVRSEEREEERMRHTVLVRLRGEVRG